MAETIFTQYSVSANSTSFGGSMMVIIVANIRIKSSFGWSNYDFRVVLLMKNIHIYFASARNISMLCNMCY